MKELGHRTDQDITNGTAGERVNTNSRVEEKVDGYGQTRDAGNDEGWGRTQGVDKMDM